MKGIVFVISGPSGAGKTSILKVVLEANSDLDFSVSYTTRKRRPTEVDGKDYIFVTQDEFRRLREEEEFLEWAKVHGNHYGTSRTQVRKSVDSGRDILLDVDIQGAMSVMRELTDAVYIFVAPPSYGELVKRLEARGTENTESLKVRLEDAKWELEQVKHFQYLVVNDNLNHSVNQLEAIITAARLRVDRIVKEKGERFLFEEKTT
ncbi:MAG TPA: guanylate kinase [Mesotoga sp.]|jgi:guanylate kinase|uniref:guanylate kinase n=1 Tax=unclassified Mesotoga TaxID=1184398 RepID=UPI000ADE8821|nr:MULTISPECIES: guanylate kinase [unclassified Mesotoga]MDD3459726.1 guanylate kinase [Mesotoga sp.]PNQ05901.1 guanylate kinase [Mesotoga sp. SC_NapDC3]PXF35164.1 guanylate kinase [Mesotoga sp. SC_NapDC]RAM61197.1 guanylate kinase [Mesotoga sp. SC_3PWM13N19]HAY98073.1 guanylate kinase [Mesotoga sp.]